MVVVKLFYENSSRKFDVLAAASGGRGYQSEYLDNAIKEKETTQKRVPRPEKSRDKKQSMPSLNL